MKSRWWKSFLVRALTEVSEEKEGLVRKKGEAKLPDYKSLQTDYGPLATSPPPPLECKISACFLVVTSRPMCMANTIVHTSHSRMIIWSADPNFIVEAAGGQPC